MLRFSMRRIVPSDSDVNDDALKPATSRQLDLQAPCSFTDVSEPLRCARVPHWSSAGVTWTFPLLFYLCRHQC